MLIEQCSEIIIVEKVSSRRSNFCDFHDLDYHIYIYFRNSFCYRELIKIMHNLFSVWILRWYHAGNTQNVTLLHTCPSIPDSEIPAHIPLALHVCFLY